MKPGVPRVSVPLGQRKGKEAESPVHSTSDNEEAGSVMSITVWVGVASKAPPISLTVGSTATLFSWPRLVPNPDSRLPSAFRQIRKDYTWEEENSYRQSSVVA